MQHVLPRHARSDPPTEGTNLQLQAVQLEIRVDRNDLPNPARSIHACWKEELGDLWNVEGTLKSTVRCRVEHLRSQ